MSILKYIFQSIRFYWRQHLALFVGILVSTMVLTGALIVGDSVRLSLSKLVDVRLGKAHFALQAGERFVRWDLATDLSKQLNVKSAPLLVTSGIGVNPEGGQRQNRIQVIGCDQTFWDLSDINIKSPTHDEAIISESIAQSLNLKVGDGFLVRLQKLEAIPVNAPFAQDINLSVAIRLVVSAVASDEQMGRFSLKTNQATPFNVFISHLTLAKNLDISGKANVVLVAHNAESNLTSTSVNKAFDDVFCIEDASIYLRELPMSDQIEILSERIFIDNPISDAIFSLNTPNDKVLTYMVNSFRFNQRETPYSFVTSATPPIVSNDLTDNDIIVNQWLANDLSCKPGDSIELAYFTVGPLRTLSEVTTKFRVKSIIPVQSSFVNSSLMPPFPGLADAGSCHDWETGIPIDLKKIRDNDEKYWNDFKGTPKALISTEAGQKMWANPFGNYTSIRINSKTHNVDSLKQSIAQRINPLVLGLIFIPVHNQGVLAANNSVDFGTLFISLSFFLIAASILLSSLIFSLNIESRKHEIGLLSGIGFPKGLILKLRLGESFLITILGVTIGAYAGIFYTRVLVLALNSVWQGAVHTDILEVFVEPTSILVGALASLLIAFSSIWFVTSRKFKQPIQQLIRSSSQVDQKMVQRKGRTARIIAILFALFSFTIVVFSINSKDINPALFLSSGAIFLAGCVALVIWYFRKVEHQIHAKPLTVVQLVFKNIVRRSNRSLATIILLALGTFSVIITGANRKTFYGVESSRTSGTGGFLMLAETTLPIPYNLNTTFGKAKLGLENETVLNKVRFVQLHRLNGDDASCLNLNQVQQPAVLGVKPEVFDSLGSFSFMSHIDGIDRNTIWLELQKEYGKNIIPAIADQTVLTWGIMKSVGDTLYYLNEAGETIKLLLVAGLSNSIFQGNILIDSKHFVTNFPSTSGSKLMLVDAPDGYFDELQQLLSFSLADYGVEVKRTSTRLAEFNTVENTYLTVFMVLGGLGIVIGTIGLGVVLLRNMLDRRSEIALLQAVGFDRKKVLKLLLTENLILLLLGLSIGLLAAIIGILPSIISPAFTVPLGFVILLLAAIFISGFISIYLPVRSSLKKSITQSLREE